jgi:hypothetical protein
VGSARLLLNMRRRRRLEAPGTHNTPLPDTTSIDPTAVAAQGKGSRASIWAKARGDSLESLCLLVVALVPSFELISRSCWAMSTMLIDAGVVEDWLMV